MHFFFLSRPPQGFLAAPWTECAIQWDSCGCSSIPWTCKDALSGYLSYMSMHNILPTGDLGRRPAMHLVATFSTDRTTNSGRPIISVLEKFESLWIHGPLNNRECSRPVPTLWLWNSGHQGFFLMLEPMPVCERSVSTFVIVWLNCSIIVINTFSNHCNNYVGYGETNYYFIYCK